MPVILEPWAKELIRRASPKAGENILDLACGTGVVTRQPAELGMQFSGLTGVDHNAGMLAVARGLGAETGLNATRVQADAGSLPMEDDKFDLAFCQQALQFFPDRAKALRELRRVLRPGGRVAMCVQRELEANPMLQSQAAALNEHVGAEAGAAVEAICSLSDVREIQELFESAGFRDVEVESVSLMLYHPDARAFAAGAMGGMHTGDKLSGLADMQIANAVDAFMSGLGKFYDGTSMRFPHVSNVISATA